MSIILVGILFYLLFIFSIGIILSRSVKINNSSDFITAGRQLPLTLSTFSLFTTWFGAGTCIGAAGTSYKEGFLGVIEDPFGATLCLILAGIFLAKVLWNLNLVTLIDLFKVKFGPRVEFVAGIIMVLSYPTWIASQLLALATLVHLFVPVIPISIVLISSTIIITVYTMIGGMYSIAVTDFIQGIILIIGLVVTFIVIIHSQGIYIFSKVPENYYNIFPHETGIKNWLFYIEAWCAIGLGSLPAQDLMQRVLSSKTASTAQKSCFGAGFLYFFVGLIPVLLGMFGYILIPDLKNSEFILPVLAVKFLHPLFLVLFLGALISAIVSTADSAILASASIITENIIPFFNKKIEKKDSLKWCRYSVVISSFLALSVSLSGNNIYKLETLSCTISLSTLVAPLFLSIYWKDSTESGILAGIISGMIVWLVGLMFKIDFPMSLIGLVISFVSIIVVSKISVKSKKIVQVVSSLDINKEEILQTCPTPSWNENIAIKEI